MSSISTSRVNLTLNDTNVYCETLEEVEQAIEERLARIRSSDEDYGELVEVSFEEDDSDSGAWRLMIGIGYEHSVVFYSRSNGSPPFYCSRGTPPPPPCWPDLADYLLYSADSEVSHEQMVPIETAREALREFIRTGEQPTCVKLVDECDYQED